MRTKVESLQTILDSKIIAIIRADASSGLIDTVSALVDGGITALEITMTTPGALDALRETAQKFGDKILLGVGSVLDAETARMAILSGAEFVVSPVFRPDVVDLARRYGKVVVPSAFTPTEVLNAWESGADLIKLFPMDIAGPQYIKAIRAPLPQIPLVAVGGVNLENAADFLKAGAVAVGMGSCLVKKEFIEKGDFESLANLCRKVVDSLRDIR